MKTVRIYHTGGPDTLRYEDAAPPGPPGAGQALVEIKAIGVNYTDVSSRKGTNPPDAFPWTPGREAAGVVTAVGPGVAEVAPGDRVAYAMHTGTYAQQHCVPAWLLAPLPDTMDFPTAAATMLQGMTAHFLVYGITQLNPGDRVLVHAGAGGMGLWLIQLLKRRGVEVFTTVSTDEKAALARQAGADHVIIYTRQDFAAATLAATDGAGVRMVLDAVGADTFGPGLRVLSRRGYMVLYGQASGPVSAVDSGLLRHGSLFLTRPSLGDYTASRAELLQRANDVLAWVQSGEVKLHIGLELPLSEAQEAHRRLEGRETTGKILLHP